RLDLIDLRHVDLVDAWRRGHAGLSVIADFDLDRDLLGTDTWQWLRLLPEQGKQAAVREARDQQPQNPKPRPSPRQERCRPICRIDGDGRRIGIGISAAYTRKRDDVAEIDRGRRAVSNDARRGKSSQSRL